MRCAIEGCSQEGRRQCVECNRHYCDKHVEICSWCNAFVCFDCRDAHQTDNPMHEEGTPNA